MTADLWTDGSFKTSGGQRAGWAYIVIVDGRVIRRKSSNVVAESVMQHRNIAAELCAVVHGLKWCLAYGYLDVTVNYDYAGCGLWCDSVGGENRWKAKKQMTQNYVLKVDCLKASGMSISWVHHNGHSGIESNDEVDKLASNAADGILVDETVQSNIGVAK